MSQDAPSNAGELVSGGFCALFRFDCRVGGAVTCPAAGRWLRIR